MSGEYRFFPRDRKLAEAFFESAPSDKDLNREDEIARLAHLLSAQRREIITRCVRAFVETADQEAMMKHAAWIFKGEGEGG